jgi:hypothetical protein
MKIIDFFMADYIGWFVACFLKYGAQRLRVKSFAFTK